MALILTLTPDPSIEALDEGGCPIDACRTLIAEGRTETAALRMSADGALLVTDQAWRPQPSPGGRCPSPSVSGRLLSQVVVEPVPEDSWVAA